MHGGEVAIRLNPKQKTVSALHTAGFKVVGIGLAKGQTLEKHLTPTPAFLLIHSGSVDCVIHG